MTSQWPINSQGRLCNIKLWEFLPECKLYIGAMQKHSNKTKNCLFSKATSWTNTDASSKWPVRRAAAEIWISEKTIRVELSKGASPDIGIVLKQVKWYNCHSSRAEHFVSQFRWAP